MNAKMAAATAAILWGFTYILTTTWLPPNPLFLAAVRALGGAIVLLALVRSLPPRAWWGRLAVLGTLKEALETSQGCDANCCVNANNSCLVANVKAIRYLKASANISPCKLAQAMSGAQLRGPGGAMDAKEFENAAAELFITRVKVVS